MKWSAIFVLVLCLFFSVKGYSYVGCSTEGLKEINESTLRQTSDYRTREFYKKVLRAENTAITSLNRSKIDMEDRGYSEDASVFQAMGTELSKAKIYQIPPELSAKYSCGDSWFVTPLREDGSVCRGIMGVCPSVADSDTTDGDAYEALLHEPYHLYEATIPNHKYDSFQSEVNAVEYAYGALAINDGCSYYVQYADDPKVVNTVAADGITTPHQCDSQNPVASSSLPIGTRSFANH